MENGWCPDVVGEGPPSRAGDEDPDSLAAILDSLGRDPALKLTDSGRAVLRWLASHALSPEDTGVFAAVPPHCANLVADIARRNAAIWQELANIVEQLSRDAM
ncbi:hypothetical protein [Amycolatopsis balhimycina]|uniref:hypothetical protein n=1 Tax=Amycolatopsis balhimycina TaxID=208443 RepID=UPI0003677EB0|nr:hypothetical protein [Amycolatopsis balhimycina]